MTPFKQKLELLKGTRLTSFLFIAFSLLLAAGIILGANMYYDIDADKIIVNEVQRVTQNLEVVGTSYFGDGGATNYATFSNTGDLSFVGSADTISKSDAALTIQTTGQNLTVQTLTSGNLAVSSAGALNLTGGTSMTITSTGGTLTINATGQIVDLDSAALDIDATGTITIDTSSGNAITINATGANLNLKTTTSGDINLDPASGVVYLGSGDVIKTATGGPASRDVGEQILREVIPIFGFDLPARCSTSCTSPSYATVSRTIEDYPFPAALTGTTRIHKFLIRYADSVTTGSSTWRVWNETTGAEVSSFTVPATSSTDLNKGEVYITSDVAIPTNTDDWHLEVQVDSGSIQIYQIFLAAYDQVD